MKEWWKEEICYQIYPKSFKDSNHDGAGDIKGITQKLDYLHDLGITLIWICPVYKSPMDDNGYDISDYEDINPEFGTMEELEELIAEAKKRNIKIIMDLVINHCSDEHVWFQKALEDPTSKYHDYFIFKQGKDGKAPNNWRGCFGGSVWEKVEGRDEYYFHTFSKKQPDLNWENKELRYELYGMINRWLEKGISGFRVDAINVIKKDQDFVDGPVDGADGLSGCFPFIRNRPGIEEFFNELRKECFDKHQCMTVAEAVGVPYSKLGTFIGDKGCFTMMFDFNYCNFDINENEEYFHRRDWTVREYRELMFEGQQEVAKTGWIATFLENHDQPRSIDKLIKNKEDHHVHSKTMLAGMFFNLQGTPFIYQGQEIGMVNFERQSPEEFDDIQTKDQYRRSLLNGFTHEESMRFMNLRSRDNARVPMQWDDSEFSGFSDVTPWIKMCGNHQEINVKDQLNDPHSVLNFYKKMIQVRKHQPTLVYGSFEGLNSPEDTIVYKRSYQNEEIYCYCSFSNQPLLFETVEGEVLLNNYEEYTKNTLQPFQFVMVKVNK